MRRIRIVLFNGVVTGILLMFFLYIVAFSVDAQVEKLNCGDATKKGYEQCCNIQDLRKQQEEKVKELGLEAPKVGPIGGMGIDFFKDKLMGAFFKAMGDSFCVVGTPVNEGGKCVCKLGLGKAKTAKVDIEKHCSKLPAGTKMQDDCFECARRGGYSTAFGCIPITDLTELIVFLFNKILLIAGLLSFVCIITAGISYQLSQGDQKKVAEASEKIRRCIIGLILVLFSVFIIYIVQRLGLVIM